MHEHLWTMTFKTKAVLSNTGKKIALSFVSSLNLFFFFIFFKNAYVALDALSY